MTKRPSPFTKSGVGLQAEIPVKSLSRLVETYLLACDIKSDTKATLNSRRERLGRLMWFVQQEKFVGAHELRLFFHYVAHSHEAPEGHWGNPICRKPLAAGRIKTIHATLRAFFNWLIEEEEIDASPMARIPAPIDRPDQITPFTDDEVRRMLSAAHKTGAGGRGCAFGAATPRPVPSNR